MRLNQILSNLISNAIKFTPKCGRIVVRIEEERAENGIVWLRFDVSDTGCGIAPENLGRIFEAFEQENADVSHKYGGTGLGLSISKRFSELMGGSLTVTSELDKGSTFTASLPFGLPETQADQWEVKGEGDDKYVTPSTNNKTIDSNAKMEKFEEHDSVGIGMAISAMSVVFCGLILLFISFKVVGKISVSLSKRNAMKAKGITDKQEAKEKQLGQAPGEVFAAISMAMHEFQSDVHDVEDTILTITRVKRSYSPWSSKIYTLRETPHKK